jgi:hypothetical protein
MVIMGPFILICEKSEGLFILTAPIESLVSSVSATTQFAVFVPSHLFSPCQSSQFSKTKQNKTKLEGML